MGMRAYSYDRNKIAGGVDLLPGEDPEALLHGFPLKGMESRDIGLATYIFDMFSGMPNLDSPSIREFRDDLAAEYARRFAEWIGYALENRANRTTKDKPMRDLEDAVEKWVEDIPNMLVGTLKPLSDDLSADTAKYIKLDKVDQIGRSIFNVIRKEWDAEKKGLPKTASTLDKIAFGELRDVDIFFDVEKRLYVIPPTEKPDAEETRKLQDLGFTYTPDGWTAKVLEPLALKMFPPLKMIAPTPAPRGIRPKGMPDKAPAPAGKPLTEGEQCRIWFFNRWLPSNLHRFSKIFNEYGRAAGIDFVFKFTLQGDDVSCKFERDVGGQENAAATVFERYKKDKSRAETWLQAIEIRKDLLFSRGKAAMAAVDRANDLQHNHGSMMEHFPPDVRRWYPSFLDFKYSASPMQMIRALRDSDLREICLAIHESMEPRSRYRPAPQTDHRTVRGLAMEITSQSGKAAKKKRLREVQKAHPELYADIVKHLESEGFHLT